jgi:hypothetical protein
MATSPLYIIIRLWIHKGRETEFESYEHDEAAEFAIDHAGEYQPALPCSPRRKLFSLISAISARAAGLR